MFSAKGIRKVALAAFAGVSGLTAMQASAAPFMTASLLGRIHGSANPFTSTVNLTSTSQTVDYVVQFQLSPEGSTNPFAANSTITNWVTSVNAPNPGKQPSTTPTSGLAGFRFSLSGSGTAKPSITNFVNGAYTAPTTVTGGGLWGAGTGSSGGSEFIRGDGGRDLRGVALIRTAGTFDGIGTGSPEALKVVSITNPDVAFDDGGTPGDPSDDILDSAITVASAGTGVFAISTDGLLATDLFLGMRWRDAGNTADVNSTINVSSQTAGAAASNPIVVFNPLTINVAPEPTGLALLGIAGLGLIRRRQA
jgi:hypothetical protein